MNAWTFPDNSDKRAQTLFAFPQNWLVAPGTFTVQIHWFQEGPGSTGGTVRWALRARCYPDLSNIDQALSTAVNLDDGQPALDQYFVSAKSAAITPTGTLTLGGGILLDVRRDNTIGGNASGNANFLGMSIFWNP